jgi:hypothetical protein
LSTSTRRTTGRRAEWVEDSHIRQSVRRRGIGTEVLRAIAVSLRQAEVRILRLHLRLPALRPSGTLAAAHVHQAMTSG